MPHATLKSRIWCLVELADLAAARTPVSTSGVRATVEADFECGECDHGANEIGPN
jgi:hypothetical protein